MNSTLLALTAEIYGTDTWDACPYCTRALAPTGLTCPSCHRIARCARCRRPRPHYGRHLCKPCHTVMSRNETLDDWPLAGTRTAKTEAARLENYTWLRSQGETPEEAARRAGVAADVFEKKFTSRNR